MSKITPISNYCPACKGQFFVQAFRLPSGGESEYCMQADCRCTRISGIGDTQEVAAIDCIEKIKAFVSAWKASYLKSGLQAAKDKAKNG